MIVIKGDLFLTEDTVFNDSIRVSGDIIGEYNLKVAGDIYAMDIIVRDIFARDIVAMNVLAGDVVARDVIAGRFS